jgi:tRNA (guanine-N7-)-methyltransferase
MKEQKFLPSFARQRIRGASSERKKYLQEEFIPKKLINLQNIPIFENGVLEIGSGNGTTATHYANLNREVFYIACEVFLDGVLKMAGKAEDLGIDNLHFFMEDGRDLLERLPNSSLKSIFLFFPDPWPKKRHHKRRILNAEFLEIAFQKLQNGGSLNVTTDHPSYKDHILEVSSLQKLFQFKEVGFPAWWKQTKYQTKALKEGRESSFYVFQK